MPPALPAFRYAPSLIAATVAGSISQWRWCAGRRCRRSIGPTIYSRHCNASSSFRCGGSAITSPAHRPLRWRSNRRGTVRPGVIHAVQVLATVIAHAMIAW